MKNIKSLNERLKKDLKNPEFRKTFDDEEVFQMWFTTKLEEGCDPYVTDININRVYHPENQKF